MLKTFLQRLKPPRIPLSLPIIETPIPITPQLSLSPLGCGTWAWGNRLLWDYNPAMDTQLQGVFNTSMAKGITLFDTGDSYGTGTLNGQSEKLLGRFAQDYRGRSASRLCIATKLAAYPWRLTRQAMVKAGRASAQRLGRPIDLVQMHWSPANYAPWQERALWDGLGDLWELGQVKAVGLSNYGPQGLRQAHAYFRDRGIAIVTLQVQYSLLSVASLPLQDLHDTCQELGVQLIAYSPLALGLLGGNYRQRDQVPKGLRGILFRQLLPSANPLLAVVDAVAQGRGKTPAQVALNWCLCKGTIPIPGAKTVAQARDNAGALGWRLDPAEVAALDQVALALDRPMVQNIFQTS